MTANTLVSDEQALLPSSHPYLEVQAEFPAHPAGSLRELSRADAPRRRALAEVRSVQREGCAATNMWARFRATRRSSLHVLSALMLLLGCAATHVQAATGSGTFRFGHISWQAVGSEVTFTLETAFRRSVSIKEWRDAKIGDHLRLFGKEPPMFLYGDSQFASTLTMEVTAVSVTEDWVMGVTRLKHTYTTPNNKDRPWKAQLVGCCRVADLKNNANLGFELTAEVDLNAASQSPRAATLPMIAVPLVGKPDSGSTTGVPGAPPSAYIPSRSGSNSQWAVGTPIDVGSVAALNSSFQSYLELPLAPLQSGHTCAQSSSGDGCLAQLVSGDSTVGGGAAALTVEGWVKIASPEGGYILSTDHLSRSMKRVSTLSIVANETHVIVGHERELGAEVLLVHHVFPTNEKLTHRWVHVAVVRTLEGAGTSKTQCSKQDSVPGLRAVCTRTDRSCHCPLCGSTAGLQTVAYRVYLDGKELSQVGIVPAEIQVTCGPQCNGTECSAAAGGSLLFGAYRGPSGNTAKYLDGWLDEWRFWNGERSQIRIQENRKVLMGPARESFTGDPTLGTVTQDNYKTVAVMLALYNMDFTCPVGVLPPCKVESMLPVYPKGESAGSNWTLVARGHVTTAAPDSQGVMIWQTAFDEKVGVDTLGRVTFDARFGPGDYQITVLLANGDGSAKVPLDMIVRVLDTANFDAARQVFPLCSGKHEPCAYADNAYVPRLQILGSVVPNGFCSGNMSRATPHTPVGDLSFLAFPCSLNTWAGYEMKIEARGHDLADGATTQVGFIVGPRPAGMEVELLRADDYGRMMLSWTPCEAAIGSHVVCLASADAQQGVKSSESEQMCVKVQVLPDPAPYFDVGAGKTTVEAVHAIIGRPSSIELYAVDDNCLDRVDIAAVELPPGAKLEKRPAPRQECTFAHSTMTWTPPYDFGGWDAQMCFEVSDAEGACGKQRHVVRHCVRVFVERCVYAIQPDQQLQEVASFYESSWIQLWSLNQGIRHPDLMMYEAQLINVGHKYKAGPRETLLAVAKRMGMPLKQLALLNHDLREHLQGGADVPLHLHQELCVVPNSCKGLASTDFSQIELADKNSLATYASDAIPVPAS